MRYRLPALAASAAAFALGAATVSQAQTSSGPTSPPPTATAEAPGTITDDQVNSFAIALAQVSALNQKFNPQIQAATDDTARTELQRQAATEMAAAVQASGISAEEYNAIAQAAQSDTALRTRIGAAMQANGIELPAS